ncbi:YciI family protein [Sphingomonas japonica]|nr:YciI family protein [Sphingomonas japonica]
MCLALLTYVQPIDSVDAQLSAHVDWLGKCFDEELLILAGRQVPRTGGVLLFRGRRAEVEALVATDPFVTSGVATVAVTEFNASMAAGPLADLLT